MMVRVREMRMNPVVFMIVVVAVAVAGMTYAGHVDDASAKQLQVVTARGNVFSLVDAEVGWMNNNTGTTITTTIINNNNIVSGNATGSVGLGYLPHIILHQPQDTITMWGNGTNIDFGFGHTHVREGVLKVGSITDMNGRSFTMMLPSMSGEYDLLGDDRLQATNKLSGYGSDWNNKDGWMELSGGPNSEDPGTSVVRLQDHYIANNPVNITGYASENATVRIVSSPNDLTRLSIEKNGFAQEVVPIDSRFDNHKVLVGTQYSSSSRLISSDIAVDLLECRAGKTDGATRGFRCHNFAYPSHPAVAHTDFHAKDCSGAVELDRRVRVGSNYIYVAEDVYAKYTRGAFLYHSTNAPDYQVTSSAKSMNSLPDIECGPKVDGYHHVSKISQNKTTDRGGTYLFDSNGNTDGTREYGQFLEQIYGNLTLNTSDHDVHFEGTGMFEETVDLKSTTTTVNKVTVNWSISPTSGSNYAYFVLESPDGQRDVLCSFVCRSSEYVATFDNADIAGDWKLYGKKTSLFGSVTVRDWSLTIGTVDYPVESMSYRPSSYTTYTLGATYAVPDNGPQPAYGGDLYLVATGMDHTDKLVMIRATGEEFEQPLVINGLPPYAPYQVFDGDALLATSAADEHGTLSIPYGEFGTTLTGPIKFQYWPDSLIYSGNAHYYGRGILIDQLNYESMSFPWDANDPLLYVATAYMQLTFPIDSVKVDSVGLQGIHGNTDFPYLDGTYNSGDKLSVPLVPGSHHVYLAINGEDVLMSLADIRQAPQSRVLDGSSSSGPGHASVTLGTITTYAPDGGKVILVDVFTDYSAYALVSGRASGSIYPDAFEPWEEACAKKHGHYAVWCRGALASFRADALQDFQDAVDAHVGPSLSSARGEMEWSAIAYNDGRYVSAQNGTVYPDGNRNVLGSDLVWLTYDGEISRSLIVNVEEGGMVEMEIRLLGTVDIRSCTDRTFSASSSGYGSNLPNMSREIGTITCGVDGSIYMNTSPGYLIVR